MEAAEAGNNPQVGSIAETRPALQHPAIFVAIIPILTPFPNVTRHIKQTISIRLKTSYWGTIFPLIFAIYAIRVCIIFRFRLIVSPWILFVNQPASGSPFPLYLCWQSFPGPFSISSRIVPSDINHRMFFGGGILIDLIPINRIIGFVTRGF